MKVNMLFSAPPSKEVKRFLDAASEGDKAVIQELLTRYGASIVNATDKGLEKRSRTALIWATICGRKEVAQLLLDNGAAVDKRDSQGKTALLHAIVSGRGDVDTMLEIMGLLLQHGASVDAKDEGGDTPLACAAGYGVVAMAELLLKNGADVNARCKDEDTPLIRAVARNGGWPVEMVELLLRYGADVYVVNARGDTPQSLVRIEGVALAMQEWPELQKAKEMAEIGRILHDGLTRPLPYRPVKFNKAKLQP